MRFEQIGRRYRLVALTLLAVAYCVVGAAAQEEPPAVALPAPPSLLPLPADAKWADGALKFQPRATIGVMNGDDETRTVAKYLQTTVQSTYRVLMTLSDVDVLPTNAIVLHRLDADAGLGEEGYELVINPALIEIRAVTGRGMFYGVQTVRQLLDSIGLNQTPSARPDVTTRKLRTGIIRDVPRFRWRGFMLDCSRHFMHKDFIKHYIDLLAYHKMNVLHWHLTDDQGWRIEIKKYPKLTEIGAWRGSGEQRYGGFYTQDDIREVLAYAKSRYVTVVPEIEMPGHCVAALAAYPEFSCTGGPIQVSEKWGVHDDVLCVGNDASLKFVEGVLGEVCGLFPSEYVHIGGDEVVDTRWKACSKCQARMTGAGLKDAAGLQRDFTARVERVLAAHGKRMIGWDEIAAGGAAPRGAIVHVWRDAAGVAAAAKAGYDVIASPKSHCYLDYAHGDWPGEPTQMGTLPLERVISFEPAPEEFSAEERKHILGIEGCLWTEHATQEQVNKRAFPRLAALAEVAWTPSERRDAADLTARMAAHLARLRRMGVPFFSPPTAQSAPASAPTK